jgi:PIN domain nuclease of toxin-antitoxin system
MKYLLDTHIFIWYLEGNPRLSAKIQKILFDESNEFYLSTKSIEEMAIKYRDGKLLLPNDFFSVITKIRRKYGIKLLQVTIDHYITLANLVYPSNHKDPFDHIIISQAIADNLILISADGNFPYYRSQSLNLVEN